MLVKLGVSIGKKAASSGYLFIARQRWGIGGAKIALLIRLGTRLPTRRARILQGAQSAA